MFVYRMEKPDRNIKISLRANAVASRFEAGVDRFWSDSVPFRSREWFRDAAAAEDPTFLIPVPT